LLHNRSNKWEEFTTEDGLPSDRVLSVWGRGSNEAWAGTDQGAARYNSRRWETDTASEGLIGQQVRAIWGDGKSTYWKGDAPEPYHRCFLALIPPFRVDVISIQPDGQRGAKD